MKGMKKMDKRTKRKKDIGKIATRIMGLVLAAMMVLSVAATLIYYIAFKSKKSISISSDCVI